MDLFRFYGFLKGYFQIKMPNTLTDVLGIENHPLIVHHNQSKVGSYYDSTK